MPGLSDLPTDIHVLLYQNLDDIDDALRLRRTCRSLYRAFEPGSRQAILRVILRAILCNLDYLSYEDGNDGLHNWKRNTLIALDFLVKDLTRSSHKVPGVVCRWHTIRLLMDVLDYPKTNGIALLPSRYSEGIQISGPDPDPARPTGIDPGTLIYSSNGLQFLADSLLEGTDRDKGDALIWAAVNGLEAVIELMLEIGADVGFQVVGEVICEIDGQDITHEWVDDFSGSPLAQAVFRGHAGAARRLLDAGADVQDISGDGFTVLHWAAAKGYLEITKELLERGADMEACVKGGLTPLEVASQHGRVETAELLLDHGANVQGSVRGALWWALADDDSSVVPLLLDRGADPNYRSTQPRSPLFNAIRNNHRDVVSMLLDKGADIEYRNERGRTAFAKACKLGSVEIAELLLAKGASLHVKDNEGRTVLHLAAEKGSEEVLKWLLRKGLDVNAQDHAGQTPLTVA
ncbi:ankyrin, partial [Aspergillus sclerotiicarbonarius CBS 121057]